MIRLGYQIPNFTYPGVGPGELFDVVVNQAKAAEAAGFDTLFVMDHFYQLPMLGAPENEMLECYSTLSALAMQTETIKLSALVTGNTYRNPTLLAKTVTTLDVISKGRAILGIGAGWFDVEHEALGFEFGTFTERFKKLEEALQIISPMIRGERVTLNGEYYTAKDAVNSPPPVQEGGIPIMIGGAGEKKTLRMVAQYAQESNLTSSPAELPRKLEVLEGHLADHGRTRDDINVTQLRTVIVDQTHEAAEAAAAAYLKPMGIDLATADDATRAMLSGMVTMGSPDEVGEEVAAMLAGGLDGITINMPANGHNTDIIALAGETLGPLVG